MNSKRLLALALATIPVGALGILGVLGLTARAEENPPPQDPAQKVLARAWVIDMTLAQPGDEVLVQGLGGVKFRLGRDQGADTSTIRMNVSGRPDDAGAPTESRRLTLTAHGRHLPVQADLTLEAYDPPHDSYTIQGQLNLDDGRLKALMGPDGKVVLLVQMTSAE